MFSRKDKHLSFIFWSVEVEIMSKCSKHALQHGTTKLKDVFISPKLAVSFLCCLDSVLSGKHKLVTNHITKIHNFARVKRWKYTWPHVHKLTFPVILKYFEDSGLLNTSCPTPKLPHLTCHLVSLISLASENWHHLAPSQSLITQDV